MKRPLRLDEARLWAIVAATVRPAPGRIAPAPEAGAEPQSNSMARALRTPAKSTDSDYAEFHTGAAVLAIFSTAAQEKYIPGATRPASKKSAILEFEVADVDQEYSRLQTIVKHWVKPPTAQPWGTRSIYFRDPDGNLIDFYAWVKPRASDLRP